MERLKESKYCNAFRIVIVKLAWPLKFADRYVQYRSQTQSSHVCRKCYVLLQSYGFCEHGNEPSGSIKCGGFLGYLRGLMVKGCASGKFVKECQVRDIRSLLEQHEGSL